MGLFEDALDKAGMQKSDLGVVPQLPEHATITSQDLKNTEQPVIKGDLAKAFAPSLGGNENRPLLEIAKDKLYEAQSGSSKANGTIIYNPDEVKDVIDRPRSILEEAQTMAPISVGIDSPRIGDQLITRFGKYAKPILTALTIDEHLIVKGISKVAGLPEKPDISDYTYTTLYRDLGAPDTPVTTALGLASSIFLSPSTYLTFGASTAAKIGVKTILTKEGETLVNKIVRQRVEDRISTLVSETGKEVSNSARNTIAQSIKSDIEAQVVKRFSEIDSAAKEITISRAVAELPERIISKGGAKLEIPFSGGREIPLLGFDAGDINVFGKTALTGETIANIADTSGIPAVIKIIKETKSYQAVSDVFGAIKDDLGKRFIYNFGVDESLLSAARRAGPKSQEILNGPQFKDVPQIKKDIALVVANWEDATAKARDISKLIEAKVSRAFSHMSRAQREEFANVALNASRLEEKITVESKTGDATVQDALDKWYGQGKYSGSKSIADQLAEKSKLLEGAGRAHWFPAILKDLEVSDVRLGNLLKPSERKFLKERKTETEFATQDPIKAISYRATEIAYANIQDKFYESIIKKKLGDAKPESFFKSPNHALAEGYVPITRPFGLTAIKGRERVAGDVIYVKKEFADHYEALIKEQRVVNPFMNFVTAVTSMWKRNVTSVFPAFHARNFFSNIILNSMHIGGQSINPKTWGLATRAVLGKDMDKVFETAIGERLTIRQLLTEAEHVGAIKQGMYHADIGGYGLNKTAQEIWSNVTLNYLNPMSEKFAPSLAGRKFGDAVETQARLVNYITHRQNGLSAKVAKMETDAALFNYHALTGFEKTYLNNALIPFYSFSKLNLQSYLKVFGHQPGAVVSQLKAMRDLGPTTGEWEKLPNWAKSHLAVVFNKQIYTGFGLPLEDVLELAGGPGKKLLLMSNPIFRYPIERVTGKDFQTGRNVKEVNAANEFKGIVNILESSAPEWLKAMVRPASSFLALRRDPSRPNKIIGDPDMLHLLRASFTSRYMSVMGQISDEKRTGFDNALQLSLGIIKVKPDAKLALSNARREAIEKIRDIAAERNLAHEFPGYIAIGGDKFAVDFIRKFTKAAQDATSPKELDSILRVVETASKRIESARTKK